MVDGKIFRGGVSFMKLDKISTVFVFLMVLQGLFVLNSWGGQGEKKVVEIIYTGRTWGQLRPCPS